MDKNSLKKAVLPASVVTAVFFLNYFCFGRENAIIGPFLTLSFLKFKDMEDYRGCMLRTLGVYCIMAAAAWAALLHPILTVVCNGLALFWIGYFLIDEYNPLNYFPAGMALIFFQNSPVSLGRLPLRLLALAVSFFLIFIFLWLQKLAQRKSPRTVERLALEGFSLCRRLLEELAQGKAEEARDTQRCLCQCNRSLSQKLYEANRAALAGNMWVFRIRAWRQCQYVMELLEELSKRLASIQSLHREARIHAMNQLVVKSYLLSSRMEEFNQTAVKEYQRKDVEQFIREHMQKVGRQMLDNYMGERREMVSCRRSC